MTALSSLPQWPGMARRCIPPHGRGRVVSSLVERDGARAAHIGYKDNPLTQLLKSGLGGHSKTALVACITSASDSLDESLNTLRFATQASHVKNKVAKKAQAGRRQGGKKSTSLPQAIVCSNPQRMP